MRRMQYKMYVEKGIWHDKTEWNQKYQLLQILVGAKIFLINSSFSRVPWRSYHYYELYSAERHLNFTDSLLGRSHSWLVSLNVVFASSRCQYLDSKPSTQENIIAFPSSGFINIKSPTKQNTLRGFSLASSNDVSRLLLRDYVLVILS